MATAARRPSTRRRRPAARRTAVRRPVRRRSRRRSTASDTLIAVGAVLVLVLAVLQWVGRHPVVLVLAALAAAGAAAVVLARRAAAAARWRQLMADRAGITHYMAMTPKQFEEALAWLCRRDGCRDVKVVGGAGDLGADVIATTPTGRRIVIQAKRYAPANKVGSPDLQKVGGTARQVHGADLVAAVTTSGFTRAAREYAAHPGVAIRLVDHDALARWAAQTGPAPWH
ncbi:restriction endonuclease [Streptomyces sp. NPDC001380]|uniref:restriction endonuclease n=1 Tax=Streptomyces sp. NPDC001380 TaxID=3364566 RepID=UPI0036CFCA78